MRHFFQGLVVTAITMLVSSVAMADNQETADLIAKNLRDSGKLGNARIGVRVQDGTAWLQGQVKSESQKAAILQAAFSTNGVSRVINNLSVENEPATNEALANTPVRQAYGAMEPERIARPMYERLSAPRVTQAIPTEMPERQRIQPTSALELTMPEPAAAPALTAPAAPTPARRPARVAQRPLGQPIAAAYRQPMAGEPTEAPPAPMPGVNVPQPMAGAPMPAGPAPYRYDQPTMPNYAWPSYAAYPNYAAVTYPRQYSPTAWPYIGPFYPYPQVPLGWRKVTMEWDDGWWWLDFKNTPSRHRGPTGCHY